METKKQGILGLQRKKFTFSRAQKHVIVQEYLTGILSKREIWEKYTGEKQEHGQILRWMRQFGYENQPPLGNNTTFAEIVTDMQHKTKSNAQNKPTTKTLENTEALQRRIKGNSLLCSIIVFLHLYVNYKWIKWVITKHLVNKHKQVFIFSSIFFVCAITGFTAWYFSLEAKEISRKLFIEIHDKMTLFFFIFLILHIWKRRKRLL